MAPEPVVVDADGELVDAGGRGAVVCEGVDAAFEGVPVAVDPFECWWSTTFAFAVPTMAWPSGTGMVAGYRVRPARSGFGGKRLVTLVTAASRPLLGSSCTISPVVDKTVGEILSALVDDQLQDERQLKDSLAQRSAIVISTSGTLVMLSLGAAALVTRKQTFAVPHCALVAVATAVALLVIAALTSLFVNGPWSQEAVELTALNAPKQAIWCAVDTERAIAAHDLRVSLVTTLRNANKQRARLLMIALSLECFAVVLFAIATLPILLRQT